MKLAEYLYFVCVYIGAIVLLRNLWTHWRKIKIVIKTFPRDFILLYRLFNGIRKWILHRCTNRTTFKSLDRIAEKTPNRTCFFYESEKWSYRQLQTMSFQVANFFQAQGYKNGDVVALAMTNRPEVVAIWLGLSRIGVITALINFNLRGESLEHCIYHSNCKSVIYGSELREVVNEIWKRRDKSDKPLTDIVLYELDRFLDGLFPISHKASLPIENMEGGTPTSVFKPHDFADCLRTTSSKPTVLRKPSEEPHFLDTLFYIYTSGTTGMPKAAKASHSRMLLFTMVTSSFDIRQDNIMYNPLPLYHTFGLVGIGMAIVDSIPCVIVSKFSASKFWSDIHYYKATVSLYMGELCRFIVNQPPQPELESNHSLRAMVGCGVKPDVWRTFTSRFNVKYFFETYGSTEGNCTLVNVEGTKVGAIGYIPAFVRPVYSVTVIKVNEITGEVIRDKETGFAIECKDFEQGELVGKIVNVFPSLRYEGYTNADATEKKIVRNVFRKGDQYFRTGDLVTRDDHSYFYFTDRIGDTFRWKGENVSTAEVEGLILRLTNMRTNVVYGVKVFGTEGRAGMAAISDPKGDLNIQQVGEGLEKELPAYARPVFIRCIRGDDLNCTGSFKVQKFNLQADGFDIERILDPIYIYSSKLKGYEKLELDVFTKIMQGDYRF